MKYGVERLVAIGLGQGNMVLETIWPRAVKPVNGTECQVTMRFRVGDDPKTINIVDLGKRQVFGRHFPVDTVRCFFPALDIAGNTRFAHFSLQGFLDVGNDLTPVTGDRTDVFRNGAVPPRIQVGKAEILQFRFDTVHTQPIGNRRVNVQRFTSDPAS